MKRKKLNCSEIKSVYKHLKWRNEIIKKCLQKSCNVNKPISLLLNRLLFLYNSWIQMIINFCRISTLCKQYYNFINKFTSLKQSLYKQIDTCFTFLIKFKNIDNMMINCKQFVLSHDEIMKQRKIYAILQKVLNKTPKPLSHLKHVCICCKKINE
jgi:hypothetical protein